MPHEKNELLRLKRIQYERYKLQERIRHLETQIDEILEDLYPSAGGIENVRRQMRARHDSRPTMPEVKVVRE